MKLFVSLPAFMFAGISMAQENTTAIDPEFSELILSFLPAGTSDTLLIVFSGFAVLNALSITLDKIAKRTESEKDDKAVSKFKMGLMKIQKVLNFFIAK